MSDETPPSIVASGVGVAAGSGVAAGVGVESELHAAMAAAVAKSAVVRSNALLRANGQVMSGNSSRQPAKRSASRIGVATTPVEAQGPRRPPQLHPSDMQDTRVAVDLLPFGRRARSSCTRTTPLLALVRSPWPPCALWPSAFAKRSCEGCHKDGLLRSPSDGRAAGLVHRREAGVEGGPHQRDRQLQSSRPTDEEGVGHGRMGFQGDPTGWRERGFEGSQRSWRGGLFTRPGCEQQPGLPRGISAAFTPTPIDADALLKYFSAGPSVCAPLKPDVKWAHGLGG